MDQEIYLNLHFKLKFNLFFELTYFKILLNEINLIHAGVYYEISFRYLSRI